MSDLVSVIIPTFNRSQFLLRAIHSVLNQTYKNIELLVVDDGSTDETHKLLTPLIENKSLHYIKKNNGGVSSARNAGGFSAKGKWIALLD
jgi:glycosyltransferase involved in cell wall biosynthesis